MLRDMADTTIDVQYSTGVSRQNIERALTAAGLDLAHLAPADLAALEDFHAMGRIATGKLMELLDITADLNVLDAGSGIGGTARFLAHTYGCRVTAVDLTEEYCETARWLDQLVGLADRISVQHASVTDLPVADDTFDVVLSQHVQMNVADKSGLYAEARRVLVDGGRLALWDLTSGDRGELDFPVPWADQPDRSHLVTPDELRSAIESAGFEIEHWNDLTHEAAPFMQALVQAPPTPMGLHAFVTDFKSKATNVASALADGRLRAIQGVARAIAPTQN